MSTAKNTVKPLCVDLDGTLIRTDLFVEMLLLGLAQRFVRVCLLIFRSLFRGRAFLKYELSQLIDLPIQNLPLNQPVIELIESARREGRRVYLATAAAQPVAERLAATIGFDGVFTSTVDHNLKSKAKAERLVAEFGEGEFDYVGDAWADLAVWRRSNVAIAIGPGYLLRRRLAHLRVKVKVLNNPKATHSACLRAVRIHQWAKNILVFIPFLCAHHLKDAGSLARCMLAFLAFGLVASAGYVVNDLLDLQNDRAHPKKKNRPFALGDIGITSGAVLFISLVTLGFYLAIIVRPIFALLLAAYFALSLSYSFRMKRVVVLDVIILAVLYSIRLLAGNLVSDIPPSDWLLGLSGFIFVSLALAKRYSELHAVVEGSRVGEPAGRGYRRDDLPTVRALGVSAGMTACLVMALYIRSPEVLVLYQKPALLWMVVLTLIFWICRLWILAGRGDLHHDPIIFTLKDRISWICGLVIAITATCAAI